jgi:hypothetical protein
MDIDEGVSYFGVTVVQEDGSLAVDGDARFDPTLSYRENKDGDFYPCGPRIQGCPDLLSRLGVGENVPAVTCPRCQQRLAEFGEKTGDGELAHRCSRVLSVIETIGV